MEVYCPLQYLASLSQVVFTPQTKVGPAKMLGPPLTAQFYSSQYFTQYFQPQSDGSIPRRSPPSLLANSSGVLGNRQPAHAPSCPLAVPTVAHRSGPRTTGPSSSPTTMVGSHCHLPHGSRLPVSRRCPTGPRESIGCRSV